MSKHKKRAYRRLALYSILAIAVFTNIVLVTDIRKRADADVAATCSAAYSRLETSTFTALAPKIGAKAAYVYDFTDNTALYSANADTPLPLASLTKLMTIHLALESVSPEKLYRIIPEDLTSEPSIGFSAGDSYTVGQLLKAALIDSSNNAAVMIARSTGLSLPSFIVAMNAQAQTLGLTSLHYESVTGLDIHNDTVATAFGSAKDILLLLKRDYTDNPVVFEYSTHPKDTIYSSTGKTIPLTNTDTAIPRLPLLVAGKTGYTDVAGGNLAVLWKDPVGRLLGVAVLGSTKDGRFDDVVRLHSTAEIYISTSASLARICANHE